MKTRNTAIVTLLSIALTGFMPLEAQNAQATSLEAGISCPGKPGKGHGRKLLSVLNDQERAQLRAAMKQVRNDPSLVTARQAAESAGTREAKKAAHESLRKIRRDLLLQADPTIAPILEKLRAAKSAKGVSA
jgi:hypothetical protein